MRTLIINGSPRPRGGTSSLVRYISPSLGDVTEIDAYSAGIAPCVDCRRCWDSPGCAVRDGMDAVYSAVAESDAVIIASPIYFSELTPPVLAVGSRLQAYYAARRFLKTELLPEKPRAGGIILVDGGDGSYETALGTAETLLGAMHAPSVGYAYHSGTDDPARADPARCPDTVAAADALAAKIKAMLGERQ